MTDDALVARLNAASHDERLSTGALYREAAARIAALTAERDAIYRFDDLIARLRTAGNLGSQLPSADMREAAARIAALQKDADRLDALEWMMLSGKITLSSATSIRAAIDYAVAMEKP